MSDFEATKHLLDVFDRPIAFHRVFFNLTGSVNAALMLSQAFYWTRITSDEHGWFYKTQKDWENEVCLTRHEQDSARNILRKTGFWQEERRGLPAKLYYRIELDRLFFAIKQQSDKTAQERDNVLEIR